MAKVVGIVPVDLKPGITDDQVQELAADFVRRFKVPGIIQARLAKADRGDRTGKYVFMWEFESVEVRDRYFPTLGVTSDAWQQNLAGAPAELVDRFFTLFTGEITDYVVLGD